MCEWKGLSCCFWIAMTWWFFFLSMQRKFFRMQKAGLSWVRRADFPILCAFIVWLDNDWPCLFELPLELGKIGLIESIVRFCICRSLPLKSSISHKRRKHRQKRPTHCPQFSNYWPILSGADDDDPLVVLYQGGQVVKRFCWSEYDGNHRLHHASKLF